MNILNLTQHRASAEQIDAGVFDVDEEDRIKLSVLLTFDELPTAKEIGDRCLSLREMVAEYGATAVMIGGAPFFMRPLEEWLQRAGIKVLYAFSKRESVEDSTGRKTSVFKHAGFYEALDKYFQ
jgi:hypothetical protein